MRLKLQQINEMLARLDRSTSVSITSADQLARELFTYRGAGTLVRRGEAIELIEQPGPEVLAKVADQVERAFEKRLNPDWAGSLADPTILMSQSSRAAAVVTQGLDAVPYLDKFAVTPDAQGEGLAAAMWQVLRAQFPVFYWRSRNANPITNWYFQQADTSFRSGPWVVFTIGIEDPRQRERVIRDALVRDSGWSEEPA
jgi:acetylglutamate kinase